MFFLLIAAPGRHPDADAEAIFCGRKPHRGEAIGEAVIDAPERAGGVPAIVHEEGVHVDITLADELFAEGVDAVKNVSGAEAPAVADVVPRVVVQEGAVGMRALLFNVSEEVSPQLAGARGADDGGEGDGFAGGKG